MVRALAVSSILLLVACSPPASSRGARGPGGGAGPGAGEGEAEAGDDDDWPRTGDDTGAGDEGNDDGSGGDDGDDGDDRPAEASGGGSGGDDGLPADAQVVLAEHNRHRAAHCAPPLTWSPKLAQAAQTWANSLRDSGCAFEHSKTRYGENLAGGTSSVLSPERVVAMWYEEIAAYRFPDGGFSMETGHFTQVVWAGTTELGCGSATCNGMTLWVCNYDPPGNVTGGYRANVKPKGCK